MMIPAVKKSPESREVREVVEVESVLMNIPKKIIIRISKINIVMPSINCFPFYYMVSQHYNMKITIFVCLLAVIGCQPTPSDSCLTWNNNAGVCEKCL